MLLNKGVATREIVMGADMNVTARFITQSQQILRAIAVAMLAAASACATQGSSHEEWTAQGYLTPGPTSEPEIIGVYPTEAECVAAGNDWMSRQVVGSPVYADCLPVDHD